MDLMEFVMTKLGWVNPRALAWLEKRLKRIPAVRRRIERESAAMMKDMEASLKPYRDEFAAYTRIPEAGCTHGAILAEMEALKEKEEARWKEGFVSGAVYHGDPDHIDFMNQVYAIHSQSNPLHADIWPSITKYESEIVAMTAEMLGSSDENGKDRGEEICGVVSSGGTESILLAMKAYRDWGREVKGIRKPEIIAATSAHAAFEKAAEYFQIKLVKIPVNGDFRADVRAAKKAITRNTVAIVGSAPSFPHGVIDPIEELSEIARRRGIGFHTDACLGGFILPWAKQLGYPIPAFDFSLPGVTSMSADTHKYGYAAKGTSVILYRSQELRHYQYFATSDWPGGLYCSPTFAGSRPGALAAACWAAMLAMGKQGYLEAAKKILETAAWIKGEMASIPELYILGDPLWVIAFGSKSLDIFQVMEAMGKKGWALNGLFSPPAVHICITLRHTQPGVDERFIEDLKTSVKTVKANPSSRGGLAPVYGMAARMPFRGMVSDLLKRYLDVLYKP
jgi:sphinganine-1-phosphate aldolase